MKCGNTRCSGVGECSAWGECDMFQPSVTVKKREKAPKSFTTEEAEQEAVIAFCELERIDVVHIPNEGKRSAVCGARLKRTGLRKGFPDLFIPAARKGYHGLFIELKRDRNSMPTAEQMEWIGKLNANGYYATVCYGATAAIEEIRKYFR